MPISKRLAIVTLACGILFASLFFGVWRWAGIVRNPAVPARSPKAIHISVTTDQRERPAVIYSYYLDEAGEQVVHGERIEYLWDPPPHRIRDTYVLGHIVGTEMEAIQN